MNARVKAALGWVLSVAPGGRNLHALMQRKVTRTLPMPERDFDDRCRIALEHLDSVRQYVTKPIGELSFFEFGAGWDLIIPQVFRAAGVQRQIVVDLNRLVSLDLVTDANERLRARKALTFPGVATSVETSALPRVDSGSLDDALRVLGVDYQAPSDASRTACANASVDVVTSSLVLEHVPPEVIKNIFVELHRIVKPGGIVSSSIDMSDHYSHGNAAVSPWDFLGYNDIQWTAMNPPLLYQNRLRASEQISLIEQAGFRIIDARPRFNGTKEAFAKVRSSFTPSYAQWTNEEDLRTTQLHVVAVRD